MGTPVDQVRRSFADAFGSIYEGYGLKRLQGLIVGLLLSYDTPQSLDDIAETLGRSKGPISQTVRQLTEDGLVRKVDGAVNRRDYYAVDPDLFLQNFRRNLRTVVKNRTTAEHFLGQLDRLDGAEPPGLRLNLEHMRAFYALMEQSFARFEQERADAKPDAF